jgi:hypothetical protein
MEDFHSERTKNRQTNHFTSIDRRYRYMTCKCPIWHHFNIGWRLGPRTPQGSQRIGWVHRGPSRLLGFWRLVDSHNHQSHYQKTVHLYFLTGTVSSRYVQPRWYQREFRSNSPKTF